MVFGYILSEYRACTYDRIWLYPWDSEVGIGTRYGLDGPGNESRLGQDFPYPTKPALGHTQPPIQWVPPLSRG